MKVTAGESGWGLNIQKIMPQTMQQNWNDEDLSVFTDVLVMMVYRGNLHIWPLQYSHNQKLDAFDTPLPTKGILSEFSKGEPHW